MQDVEKTEIQRHNNARRIRRRNRMRPLYGLVVAVLVVFVGVALSRTVFFNIQTIVVDGSASQYSKDDIAHASGVHTGDNLMRVDADEVKQNVLSECYFVESVTVKKEFPDELVITVTPSEPAYNVVDDSGTLQVDVSGKILKNSPETDASLPTITGFEAEVREPGQMLASKDSQKDAIFQTLTELIAKGLDCPITAIDLTDKYDIALTFDNRVEFFLGNWSDLEYKVTLAETVLTKLSSDKIGYLSMVGDHQCSYRDKEAVEQQTTAPMTTLATDENGDPVVETDENGDPISTTTETTAAENDWQ